MIRVGITGGIGSGKTTVCRIFESIGIPVYYADDRAKELMYRSTELKTAIKKLLGPDAYHRNGRPNRKVIGSKIFADKALLKGINEIVHPAVAKDSDLWYSGLSNPYALKEAALLVENGSYKQLDRLITVVAPDSLRIRRVMKRDKTTKEAIVARMNNQLPQADKIKVADFVIRNDENQSLIKQVWNIHNQLMRAANSPK